MERTNDAAKNIRRLVWIVAILSVLVLVAIVASVALFVISMFHILDGADAHVCGLAAVRASPAAARLVGAPIEQQGFTGGSSSLDNGELSERITFTVKGPRGTAFVVSQGHRSPLASHLDVRMGRGGSSEIVYSGPFDCAALHRHKD